MTLLNRFVQLQKYKRMCNLGLGQQESSQLTAGCQGMMNVGWGGDDEMPAATTTTTTALLSKE